LKKKASVVFKAKRLRWRGFRPHPSRIGDEIKGDRWARKNAGRIQGKGALFEAFR